MVQQREASQRFLISILMIPRKQVTRKSKVGTLSKLGLMTNSHRLASPWGHLPKSIGLQSCCRVVGDVRPIWFHHLTRVNCIACRQGAIPPDRQSFLGLVARLRLFLTRLSCITVDFSYHILITHFVLAKYYSNQDINYS